MRSSLPTSHYFVPLPRPGTKTVNNPLPPTGKSNFVSQFEFVGSVANSAFLCIGEAIRFRREVCGGEEAIMKYCFALARDGGQAVARILGTEVMDNQERTLTYQCCMVNIQLPLRVSDTVIRAQNGDAHTVAQSDSHFSIAVVPRSDVSIVTHYLTSACAADHHTFIAIIFYADSWWARFSAQIYLELEDFEYGAHALSAVCQKVAQKAYLPAVFPLEAGSSIPRLGENRTPREAI